jgi:hypothetical protein
MALEIALGHPAVYWTVRCQTGAPAASRAFRQSAGYARQLDEVDGATQRRLCRQAATARPSPPLGGAIDLV